MPQPLPHQWEGARFLAERDAALLADAPRVGKTGAAILAADDIFAKRILVVTTASGRPVWVRGFAEWSIYDLPTRAVYGTLGDLEGPLRLVVSWSEIVKHAEALAGHFWDLLILDESHYAKSVEAKRTKAVYGLEGRTAAGVAAVCSRTWCLTGTPIPNAPNDLYPMLRTLAPERINDVLGYEQFLYRYCVVRKKAISRYNKINVVVGGRNTEELRNRMDGFWLRRTQKDVGIMPPVYEILPIHISDRERRRIEEEIGDEAEDILAAAETGETRALDMHLGTLRRLTGTIKAKGVAQAVADEFDGGLDKIVLMCWHKDVMDTLAEALSKWGVVRVDGGTTPQKRDAAIQAFQQGDARVFVGQIIAAGEAIDLSAAAELIFVESSFVPKDMAQAALRITNHGQTRQTRVRVAALEGSIDEAVQAIVVRKVATNKEIIR